MVCFLVFSSFCIQRGAAGGTIFVGGWVVCVLVIYTSRSWRTDPLAAHPGSKEAQLDYLLPEHQVQDILPTTHKGATLEDDADSTDSLFVHPSSRAPSISCKLTHGVDNG